MSDDLKAPPAYYWMTEDAREEGIEQGLEQGRRATQIAILEERRAAQVALSEQLRRKFIASVTARFPKLVRFARKQISDVEDTELLMDLVIRVNTAQNADEVKQYLLDLDEGKEVAQ